MRIHQILQRVVAGRPYSALYGDLPLQVYMPQTPPDNAQSLGIGTV